MHVELAAAEWIDWYMHRRHNLNGIISVAGYLLTVNNATGALWRIGPRSGDTVQVDLNQVPVWCRRSR